MTDESDVYLELAKIWHVNYDTIERMVYDYIERDISKYGAKTWPKPHIHIRPVKIKTLKERLEELMDDRRRTNYKNVRQTQ